MYYCCHYNEENQQHGCLAAAPTATAVAATMLQLLLHVLLHLFVLHQIFSLLSRCCPAEEEMCNEFGISACLSSLPVCSNLFFVVECLCCSSNDLLLVGSCCSGGPSKKEDCCTGVSVRPTETGWVTRFLRLKIQMGNHQRNGCSCS